MMSYFIFVVWKSNTVKKSTVLKMVVIINYFLDLRGNTKDLLSISWTIWEEEVKNLYLISKCVYIYINQESVAFEWQNTYRSTEQGKKSKVKNKTTKHLFISSILLYKVLYIFTMWNLPWEISNTSIGFYLSLSLISFPFL